MHIYLCTHIIFIYIHTLQRVSPHEPMNIHICGFVSGASHGCWAVYTYTNPSNVCGSPHEPLYIHIFIYIWTYVYVYKYMYTNVIHIHIHNPRVSLTPRTYIYIYIHIYKFMYTYTYIYTFTYNIYIHAYPSSVSRLTILCI